MLATVIVLFRFAAAEDEALVKQMQPELDAVFELTPVRVQLRMESGATNLGTPDAVAYVNVTHCGRPTLTRVAGALARTQVVDGVVQPLIEVNCAKVATYIRSTAGLPRALARVLAHELLHYLLQEAGHARTGILQASFSPFELTDPNPPLVWLAPSY